MEEYRLSKQFVDETLKEWSKSLVGEVMRKFEIINDVGDVKRTVKEVIHENCRHLKRLLKAFSSGVKFIRPSDKSH